MVDLPLSTFTPSTGAPHAFHVPVLLTPATCRPLSGLRKRCCAAPRWPRRCHGDGAGRGQAEAWGGPGDGPVVVFSLLPSLSPLFSFCFRLFSFSHHFLSFPPLCPSLFLAFLFPEDFFFLQLHPHFSYSYPLQFHPCVAFMEHVRRQRAVRKFGMFALLPVTQHTPTGARSMTGSLPVTQHTPTGAHLAGSLPVLCFHCH